MFTFPSQKQTQGHYRRSYPWCNNRNKGVWKEDWKKGKGFLTISPLAVHSPATLQTNIRLGGRGSVRSVPLVLNRQHPQIRLNLLSHMHSFTGTLLLCRALSSSYNCRWAISPLVSSKAVKRHCSDGGGGCVYVCVRMYVCLCSSAFVRERGSMRATEGGVIGDRGEERGKQLVVLNEKEKAERVAERSLKEKIQGVLPRMAGMNRE